MQKTSVETLYSIFKNYPIICTDTRKVQKDSLFFALKGENFNGNKFATQALESGSKYAIVDEEEYRINENYLLVDDVLTALQNLASHHRNQLKIPVIGITGSNGKTTSKELIHAVLSTKYKTLATQGNLNNHIGVPLTLLAITNEHEMAVIEMGANHMKEIEFLSSIASPDFGIITNIGKAHLEGFGSEENIAKGKSELYQHIQKKNGLLFVNGDNELLISLSQKAKRITYGTNETCDFKARFIDANPFVRFSCSQISNSTNTIINTQLIGKYNFENCVAAACMGNYFKVEESKIIEALQNYVPSNNRSQVITKGSNTILMDAYNANPSSMEVAITNFAEMKAENKLVILGEMLELGAQSEKEHQQLINLLQQKNLINAILIGELFKNIKNTIDAKLFSDNKIASEYLKQLSIKNSTILLKGSRGNKLEVLLDAIEITAS